MPWPRPSPKTPPEPSPIMAWTIWKPVPWASCHGWRKLKTRARRYGSIQIAARPRATARLAPAPSVRGVPLEVRAGVGAAERGRGRRGAVDHDEPERDQAERHEHQQPRLQLPLPHSCQVLHEAAELLAAALEVLELVVARAGRREEHDLAGLGRGSGTAHGRREVAAPLVRHRGGVERAREVVRRLADEVRPADAPP